MNPLLQHFSDDNAPLIISGSKTITAGEFTAGVFSRAEFYSEAGIKKYDYVPVAAPNTPQYISVLFALWHIGAVPVPMNTRLTLPELENIVRFTEAGIVISDKEIGSGLFKCIPLDDISQTEPSGGTLTLPGTDAEAVVLFTSGSTGTPKGVVHTFGSLINSAYAAVEALNQQPGSSWLASLPFFHIGGFSVIIRAVLGRSVIIFPSSPSADDVKEAIVHYKPDYLSLVTTQLKQLLDDNVKAPGNQKGVLLGGGFIDDSLTGRAEGWKLYKVYGSTETSAFVTLLPKDKFNVKPGSSGKALPGTEIVVLDDSRSPLPAGAPGEIAVKGNTLFTGYLYNPDETAAKFYNGYYLTGDYGYLDDEGYLYVLARRTDLIISGGENIYPAEVESVIASYPGVTGVIVVGLEDDKWGHIPAALIETSAEVDLEKLKSWLRNHMAGYKIPKLIKTVPSLPRTPLGKISRPEALKVLSSEF